MKTFYFNTGVEPYKHNPPVPVMPGNVVRGTICIPFDCEDVPENSTFLFACDNPEYQKGENIICREMKNTRMISKYAFFRVN